MSSSRGPSRSHVTAVYLLGGSVWVGDQSSAQAGVSSTHVAQDAEVAFLDWPAGPSLRTPYPWGRCVGRRIRHERRAELADERQSATPSIARPLSPYVVAPTTWGTLRPAGLSREGSTPGRGGGIGMRCLRVYAGAGLPVRRA